MCLYGSGAITILNAILWLQSQNYDLQTAPRLEC
jgi:hypothetical protein